MTREQPSDTKGYVLAGGASSRFGSDKALARIGGQAVLARMCDLVSAVTGGVTVIAPPNRYRFPNIRMLADRWPGEGPLGGILTALHATAHGTQGSEWNLIVGCDMPFLTSEWLRYLNGQALASEEKERFIEQRPLQGEPQLAALGTTSAPAGSPIEVALPQSEYGLEPLCACWRTSAGEKLQEAFDQGVRKVTEAMKRLRMEVLDGAHWKRFDSAGRLFWNMNTPQEYEEALRVWETGIK